MVAEPAVTPVTTPDVLPTAAMATSELSHAPSGVALNKLMVCPAQTLPKPTIDAGSGLTVIDLYARHPVGSV